MTALKAPLKMKDLQSQTGVSREAIHFYLREGLLPQPERPKHNVAHYSEEHVVRIQAIKRMQRDRALSLSDIKTLLSNFDYSALPASEDLANFELALHTHIDGDLPSGDQTLAEVSQRTGFSLEALEAMDRSGAICVKRENGEALLDFRDVGIVECWARLLQRGFAEKAAYDAEYLARYADSIRPVAEFAVDTFLREFGAASTVEAAELAAEGIGLSNEILTKLHTQALMRELKRRIEQER